MGKLIFFDIDGTIITEDHVIPGSAVHAIRSARANGHLAVVNTGRPMSHIEPSVTAIGFDAFLCSCGAYIRVGDRTLLHSRPSADVCREMVALVRRCRIGAVFEAESGIYFDLTRPLCSEARETRNHYQSLGFDTDADIDKAGFSFDKFVVYEQPESDMAAFRQSAGRHFDIIDREGNLFELVLKGCSKASAGEYLARQLDVPFEDTFAVGDSTNDLSMLSSVAHGIAMGNSPDALKAAAEFVTADIREDGIEKALLNYSLISM